MRRTVLLLVCAFLAVPAVAQTTLNGAGATFPYPMYSKWFSEYHKLHSDIQINYQSIGSGGGIRQVTEGHGGFRSQRYANDGRRWQRRNHLKTKYSSAERVGSGRAGLQHSGGEWRSEVYSAALAGIFLGKITKWNDKEITSVNPGVNLPDRDIIVVHRSDGSGTTLSGPTIYRR